MTKQRFILSLLLLALCLSGSTGLSSCKAKYGCPSNEQVQPKLSRKGKVKSGRSQNHDLFDKKTRKRMGH